MKTFPSKIVGSTFAKSQNLIKNLKEGESLIASPEPTNKFDPNAIAVLNSTQQKLGYIPAETAANLKGKTIKISVLEITGLDKPNVGCNILIQINEENQ